MFSENVTFLSQKTCSTDTSSEAEENQCQKMEVDNVRELTDVDSGIENMEVEEIKDILSPVEVGYSLQIGFSFHSSKLLLLLIKSVSHRNYQRL